MISFTINFYILYAFGLAVSRVECSNQVAECSIPIVLRCYDENKSNTSVAVTVKMERNLERSRIS